MPAAPKPKTQTATNEDVKHHREELAADTELSDAPVLGDIDPSRTRYDFRTGRLEFKSGRSACWWTSSDADASVRSYSKGGRGTTFWPGSYSQKAICEFSGLPIAINCEIARINEFLTYPALHSQMLYKLGEAPIAVYSDLGLTTTACGA